MTRETRKIGLGVMGFADMLVRLGIRYDSEEGVEAGRELMYFIRWQADLASSELARERGNFPAYTDSPMAASGVPMRNACRLTVAPTGTISMIAGCSSGIEPLFALCYHKHNILEGENLLYVDTNFERIAKHNGDYSTELMTYLADGGSLQDREDVSDKLRSLFVTAADISPEYHVEMQAAFQQNVDAGISKTINFPNSATREDVRTAYIQAWETACKGITVYRAGSRDLEVLTSGSGEKPTPIEEDRVTLDRPRVITGETDRVRTGHGTMYVTLNSWGERPFEIFSNLGKSGGCDSAQLEAISRLISLAFRSGVEPGLVIKQLKGITCCPIWDEGILIGSVPDAIAISLSKRYRELVADVTVIEPTILSTRSKCPECSSPLAFQEGCEHCVYCGYEKCG